MTEIDLSTNPHDAGSIAVRLLSPFDHYVILVI